MAKYLLLFLLLLLRIDHVQAGCYYTQSSGGMPVYGSVYGNEGQTTQFCQQLACSIWPGMAGCPSTCNPETQTQTLGCESGYEGSITQTNTKSCPSGAWSGWVTTSNTCVSTCQQVSQTQTISCPANQSGSITQTNTKTCPTNQWQGWVTTSNTCTPNAATCQTSSESQSSSCPANQSGGYTSTRQSSCPDPYGSPVWGPWQTSGGCTPNPPTCKTSQESQGLACQTGYTGTTTQTRTSSCPDPYGSPVFGPWATTSDTCVKSMSNPTNPTSPVSPINPNSPVSQPPVLTATAPQNAAATQVMNNPVTSPVLNQTMASPTTSSTQTTTTPAPVQTKQKSVVTRVLSLEQTVKPGMRQNQNPFPSANINQEIPDEIKRHHQFFLDLLKGDIDFSQSQNRKLNNILKDTVEIEQ